MKEKKELFTRKNIFFIAAFALAGFIALQIPVAKLAGSKTAFTVFDFFAPIATGFIGIIPGIIAVFLMQFANFLFHGAEIVDAGTTIRFLPMLFGAWYFGRKDKGNILIPVAAIIAFIAHPVGREVWFYSLYWFIPIGAYFWRDNTLLARALGATFTAHAVGGALWIWTFNLPPAVWISLIPVVFVERVFFAFGIAISYVLFTNLLYALSKRNAIPKPLFLEHRYVPRVMKHYAHS